MRSAKAEFRSLEKNRKESEAINENDFFFFRSILKGMVPQAQRRGSVDSGGITSVHNDLEIPTQISISKSLGLNENEKKCCGETETT